MLITTGVVRTYVPAGIVTVSLAVAAATVARSDPGPLSAVEATVTVVAPATEGATPATIPAHASTPATPTRTRCMTTPYVDGLRGRAGTISQPSAHRQLHGLHTYDGVATVTATLNADTQGYMRVGAGGAIISTDIDGLSPAACGAATVTNTDTIVLTAGAASPAVSHDQPRGRQLRAGQDGRGRRGCQ